MFLLDTPIVFELRKARAGGAEAGLTAWAAGVARERLFLSAISLMELEVAATEAARRQRLAVDAIARLQREQEQSAPSRPARKVAEELDTEEKILEELRIFRAEAERVAGLGWEPDLDDGLVLCAAPLAGLFPAWPDAKKARDELRKGRYQWATVAHWAGEL